MTAAAASAVAECVPTVGLKVVALCGSLREGGLTRKALEVALQGAKSAQCDVELLDLSAYKLYFCDGLDPQSKNAETVQPNDVTKLRSKLRGATGILLGTPEYHGSFSGVLKNAIDLCGFEEFEGKVVGLCAVSGGAMGGVSALNGLRDVSRALHAWVIPAQVTVPQAWKNLDNEDMQKRLYNLGRDVGKYSQLHANKEAQAFLESFEKGGWENPGGQSDGSAMPKDAAVTA